MIIFLEKRRITRDDGKPYMTRFTIFECSFISFKIHKFVASDDQCLHDHPWAFISFILKNGYVEVTPPPNFANESGMTQITEKENWRLRYRSIRPFNIIYRPAKWIHRVEIQKPAWTFVISFKRTRKWGFYTQKGWMHWKLYSQKEHC